MEKIDQKKLVDVVIQSIAVGVLSFGVSCAKTIGTEIMKLNESFIGMKFEIKSILEKLDSHEQRLQYIERKDRKR